MIESGTAPVRYDIASWDDLERWFLDQVELQKKFEMTRSCPFGTIGNGLTGQDELIRLDLCRIFDAVRMRIAAFFIKESAGAACSGGRGGTLGRLLYCGCSGRHAYGQNQAQQSSRRDCRARNLSAPQAIRPVRAHELTATTEAA